MKIAVICAPFGEMGGPELTTIQLADSLTEKGVDVTLFAPADFPTKATLVPTLEKSFWKMKGLKEMTTFEKRNLFISSQIKILSQQDNFDLIHISSQRYAYAVSKNLKKPCVVTLHSRMNPRDYTLLKTTNAYTIALTEKYKEEINADTFVHVGIPTQRIAPSFRAGSGLITIGRITDQKGIHLSAKIALEAGKQLLIIGRIGNSHEREKYYSENVQPFIEKSGGLIRHIKEIPNEELLQLVAKSEALLLPITRPETFGRVSIEALACGTPVIGTCRDPLPEILTDKNVSFLSEDIQELITTAQHTEQFDRKACRKYAESHFDVSTMADRHIEFYEKVLRIA